jgi:hypothetical protein
VGIVVVVLVLLFEEGEAFLKLLGNLIEKIFMTNVASSSI